MYAVPILFLPLSHAQNIFLYDWFFKVYKKRNETHLALTYFSWANDLDPKGASGARRHIKEVIDPTSSLSLIVPAGSSSEQPLQASVNNDQQGKCNIFLSLFFRLMKMYFIKCSSR